VEARSDGSREIVAGGDLLARARPATLELDVPAPPTLEEAIAAAGRARFSGAEHPFPDCFVCGPDRLPADGFRLVPGPLGRDNASAVDWWPYPALAGADGYVRPEFVWAALDCPGGLATAEATGDATPMVLGRITAALERPVPAEEPYVVIGWFIGAEGRKRQAGTAIFGADGTRYGLALATWFQVATAALQQAA
jgi:hypothetical protein